MLTAGLKVKVDGKYISWDGDPGRDKAIAKCILSGKKYDYHSLGLFSPSAKVFHYGTCDVKYDYHSGSYHHSGSITKVYQNGTCDVKYDHLKTASGSIQNSYTGTYALQQLQVIGQ